jgi:hypothetical protein
MMCAGLTTTTLAAWTGDRKWVVEVDFPEFLLGACLANGCTERADDLIDRERFSMALDLLEIEDVRFELGSVGVSTSYLMRFTCMEVSRIKMDFNRSGHIVAFDGLDHDAVTHRRVIGAIGIALLPGS